MKRIVSFLLVLILLAFSGPVQAATAWAYVLSSENSLYRAKSLREGKPNYLAQSVTRPGNKTLTYSYDLGDRLSSVLDPEGLTTTYSYSNRNELNSVTHANQTVSYVHDLIGETTLANYPNGVQAQQAFSERNQLLFKTYLKGTSPLITLKYGFNQLGQRIVGEQIDSTGSTLHRYGYNSRRELVASSVDGPKNQHSGMAYSLDQNDNLINDNGTPFTSNAADQLTKAGSTSLGYNGAGQATSVGQQAMTFAYNDQIKAITGPGLNAQYLYDGAGQRVQKTVNGTVQKFLWNGGNIAKEYKADGTVRADYQLGAGAQIDGKWQFYISDIQGSTLGIADDHGNVIAQYSYSDYGITTQTSGDKSLYQPLLYTHCELDAETGFYNNRARQYAPKLGKFLARDPIASHNRYSYANSDPINYSDPNGLQASGPECSSWPEIKAGNVRFRHAKTLGEGVEADFQFISVLWTLEGMAYPGYLLFGSAPFGTGVPGATIAEVQSAVSRTWLQQVLNKFGLGIAWGEPIAEDAAGYILNGTTLYLTDVGLGSIRIGVITVAHELFHHAVRQYVKEAGEIFFEEKMAEVVARLVDLAYFGGN